jgi:hypothetical protein
LAQLPCSHKCRSTSKSIILRNERYVKCLLYIIIQRSFFVFLNIFNRKCLIIFFP